MLQGSCLRLQQALFHLRRPSQTLLVPQRTMATTAFSINAVPVQIPPNPSFNLSSDELQNFPAFKTWLITLSHSLSLQQKPHHPFHRSPYSLRSISIQSIDRFGGGRLGFVKLSTEVSNDNGEKLPGSVFLRGGSVGMLVILYPSDTASQDADEEAFVPLTVQPRIPAGSLALPELPAGMLDDSGRFAGAAAKEIEEELGLKVKADELFDLTATVLGSLGMTNSDQEHDSANERLQQGVYTSPGGCDEFVPLLAVRKAVPRSELAKWEGKLTGLRGDGEKITLRMAKLSELWREGARDAKALSAFALYTGLKREGNLPF